MLGQTTNSLLKKMEQDISAKVPANMKDAFERTITAGLTIMYSASSNKIMKDQLSKPGDPLSNVGEGAAKLVGKLIQQSNHTMPNSIAAPAAMIFMCEGLDFLEKSGKIEVNPDTLSQAAQDTGAYVLQVLGVSQDMLHSVVEKHGQQGATQAPQSQPGIIGAAMGAK